ncbi:MAG: DNA polymerase III subunit alpha [Pseudobacteriovorax sp.]|nr:DNA polymerase III subunit alpha [Pseudobacteriovorax sp.]
MDQAQENPNSIAQLHVHSEYSLLDGANRISDLIKKAKSQGHTALAMTDHGNMFGAIEFYGKCKDADIKPILGAELYWEGQDATKAYRKDLLKDGSLQAFHLVVLGKSLDGYRNLCRLVSSAYLRGEQTDQGVSVVPPQSLEDNAGDIIALSSCLHGEFGFLVSELARTCENPVAALEDLQNPISKALHEHVQFMKRVFAPGHYFIEITDNNLPIQKALLPVLVECAKYFELPLIATSDCHYLERDDTEAHAVLTAVKNDLKISDISQRNKEAEFHFFDNEEMLAKYGQWPESIANIANIVDQCHINFEFGEYFLPTFDVPENESETDALIRFSKEGLEERLVHLRKLYGKELDEEREKVYWERLDYELNVIKKMGFPGYFLIVQDFINWAKDNDIPVGPGRGSGAGSLVAYALKITDLDPLKFNLIFERFLNPERISMPDFDVDFCQERRDEVIQYVTKKYGEDNVAQITTFGKMKAKAALRDVGRVLELGYGRVDRIAKLIPNELDIKLQEALDKEPRIYQEAKRDDMVQKMIELGLKLEGLSRHTSVHAAGVVISEGGMENYVPVYKSEDGALITQYEMKNAEKVGLVKFDFLGLKTLTVIQKAVKLIQVEKDPNFNIETIDLESKPVYDLISSAASIGIFQLESTGMQALLSKLKPSRFEDIIAVVALFRPGPLGSGMVDDFIERKHGRQEIVYTHPNLESILDDTYGIILYQEQVQKIAASLASYSLGEADLLRRAMGKKKPEEMAKQKVRFISGCEKNKVDGAIAEELFELMAKFAAYGFNKSHSAAYGLVSYQTAFLKTYYPEEFMAAIMTCDLDNTDKIVRYIEECRRMKFKIFPPDINRSKLEFDVPGKKSVGYGLAAIKGVGGSSLEAIVKERQTNGPYASLTDFAKRINLARIGKKTIELLVQAGALDSFSKSRDALVAVIPEMVKFSDSHHSNKSQGQMLLFEDDDVEDNMVDIASFEQKILESESQLSQLEWLLSERKNLGVFLSGHPIDLYENDSKRFGQLKIKDIPTKVGSKDILIVAFLSGVSERLTKTNKKMAYIQLEDETGSWETVMFEKDIPDEWPQTNTVVQAKGSISKSYDGTSINFKLEQIFPLEEIRREMVRSATIDIHTGKVQDLSKKDIDEQKKRIKRVAEILKRYPGKTPVRFHLNYANVKVRIKAEDTGIDLCDGCYQKIRDLNKENIYIHY